MHVITVGGTCVRILGVPCIGEGTGTLMIASNRALEVKYGRGQVYCYAVERKSFKGDFEATQGQGELSGERQGKLQVLD